MRSVLFTIEPHGVEVPAHPVMLALAVMVGCVLVSLVASQREGLPAKKMFVAALLLGAAAVVGARLHYVVLRLSWYRVFPWEAFRVRYTGYHAIGGLVGLLIALPVISRALKIPIGKWADATLLGGAVAVAVARIGCLLNGCCYGLPCGHAWCVAYPSDSSPYLMHRRLGLIEGPAAQSATVHPIALYFVAAAVVIALGAYLRYPRKRYDGEIALYGCLAFAVSTAAIEVLRQPGAFDVVWLKGDQRLWLAMGASGLLAAVVLGREYFDNRWNSGRETANAP